MSNKEFEELERIMREAVINATFSTPDYTLEIKKEVDDDSSVIVGIFYKSEEEPIHFIRFPEGALSSEGLEAAVATLQPVVNLLNEYESKVIH